MTTQGMLKIMHKIIGDYDIIYDTPANNKSFLLSIVKVR